ENPKRLPFDCAVCVPPGAQLRLHDIPEHIQKSLGVGAVEEVTFVERSANAFIHRDGVRFSNGRQVLLQNLHAGQRVDVLSLSGCDDREDPKDRTPNFKRAYGEWAIRLLTPSRLSSSR